MLLGQTSAFRKVNKLINSDVTLILNVPDLLNLNCKIPQPNRMNPIANTVKLSILPKSSL